MRRIFSLILGLGLPALACGEEATWQGRTAAQWAEQLVDKEDRVRWFAAHALGSLGPAAAVTAGPLSKTLENDPHEYVRGNAAWALGRLGPAAKPAIPLLIKTLASRHVSVRRNSARALGNLGPAARPAVAVLVKLLEDADAEVRVNAAVALWKIDRHANAVPALVAMAQRCDAAWAYPAVIALGQIGPQAEAAAPALSAALQHPDPDVRRAAARALGAVRNDQSSGGSSER